MPRTPLSDAKQLTRNVPSQRRFCLLYTEYDGSICRAEGSLGLEPHKVLNLIIAGDEEKNAITRWMEENSRPHRIRSIWIGWNRGKFAIVRVK